MECLEWHMHLSATDCPQSGILTCHTLYVVWVSDHQYMVFVQVAEVFHSFQSAFTFLQLFLEMDRREDLFYKFLSTHLFC